MPTFGADGNYIALLHDYDPELAQHLQREPLPLVWSLHACVRCSVRYCGDVGQRHRARVKVYGQEPGIPLTLHLHCSWPHAEAHAPSFQLLLETEAERLGQMEVANLKARQKHHTVACVRDLYYMNETGNNSPYQLLPQWLEFHKLHGIEHFFVYTFGKPDVVIRLLLRPYLLSGLATEIHFQE